MPLNPAWTWVPESTTPTTGGASLWNVTFTGPSSTPSPRLPNVVVLTSGHTGSSIVTWMLHQLGWYAPPDVDQFVKSLAIPLLAEYRPTLLILTKPIDEGLHRNRCCGFVGQDRRRQTGVE